MAIRALLDKLTDLSNSLKCDKSEVFSPVNQLTQIFKEYQNSTDHLSVSIFNWSFSLLTLDATAETKRKEALELTIQTLMQNVLVNPLDKTPLSKPMLDRQWTWEEWMLKDVLSMCSLSPFDLQPIEPKVHHFATRMITWGKEHYTVPLELQVLKNSLKLSPSIAAIGPVLNAQKITCYVRLAHTRMVVMQHENATSLLEYTQYMLAEEKQNAIELQQKVEKQIALQKAEHVKLEKNTQQASAAVVDESIHLLNDIIQQNKVEILSVSANRNEASQKSQEQQKKIIALEARLASMRG